MLTFQARTNVPLSSARLLNSYPHFQYLTYKFYQLQNVAWYFIVAQLISDSRIKVWKYQKKYKRASRVVFTLFQKIVKIIFVHRIWGTTICLQYSGDLNTGLNQNTEN